VGEPAHEELRPPGQAEGYTPVVTRLPAALAEERAEAERLAAEREAARVAAELEAARLKAEREAG
jgi:hypothetical protein